MSSQETITVASEDEYKGAVVTPAAARGRDEQKDPPRDKAACARRLQFGDDEEEEEEELSLSDSSNSAMAEGGTAADAIELLDSDDESEEEAEAEAEAVAYPVNSDDEDSLVDDDVVFLGIKQAGPAVVENDMKPAAVPDSDLKPAAVDIKNPAAAMDEFGGISDEALLESVPAKYGGSNISVNVETKTWTSCASLLAGMEQAAEKECKFDALQLEALTHVRNGENIFINGIGGTGKSTVLKEIMRDHGSVRRGITVTPTGITAFNLGKKVKAQTLYKFANVGHATSLEKFKKYFKAVAEKWRLLDFIIFEEISMFPADLLDWLDHYVRRMRMNMGRKHKSKVFGGIQVICIGDFGQLGPIRKKMEMFKLKKLVASAIAGGRDPAEHLLGVQSCCAFAFQSVFWKEAKFKYVTLRKNFRHDESLRAVMNDLRAGRGRTPAVLKLVKECTVPLHERKDLVIPDGLKPTMIYGKNVNVNALNNSQLDRLEGTEVPFQAEDSTSVSVTVDPNDYAAAQSDLQGDSFFTKDCSASALVRLKVGAQVMLVKNLSETLVNGSRGVVTGFADVPIAKSAVKSHFGQKEVEERRVVEDDVARDLFGKDSWRDVKFTDEGKSAGGRKWVVEKLVKFPIVEFLDGGSQVIMPALFEHEIAGKGTCLRMQVPLRLAWALTVHKLQGMELDLCVLDCKDLFGYGMGYTGFSRAKTVRGLQVVNFNANKIRANPLVLEFDQAIEGNGDDVDAFLGRCGVWFYPLLHDYKLLEDVCSTNKAGKYRSMECRQFAQWVKQYGPRESYLLEGGHMCPQHLHRYVEWHRRFFFNVQGPSPSAAMASGIDSGSSASDTVDLTGVDSAGSASAFIDLSAIDDDSDEEVVAPTTNSGNVSARSPAAAAAAAGKSCSGDEDGTAGRFHVSDEAVEKMCAPTLPASNDDGDGDEDTDKMFSWTSHEGKRPENLKSSDEEKTVGKSPDGSGTDAVDQDGEDKDVKAKGRQQSSDGTGEDKDVKPKGCQQSSDSAGQYDVAESDDDKDKGKRVTSGKIDDYFLPKKRFRGLPHM